MPTTALTHPHPAPSVPLPPIPGFGATRSHKPSVDSLLSNTPGRRADMEPEIVAEAAPGIFMGLRIALLFNAGLGILGLLAYETWMMLAH